MTGMGSENATTTSLPRPSSRCIIPSEEPIASPSGRACDETRNRWRSPISCSKAEIFSEWLMFTYVGSSIWIEICCWWPERIWKPPFPSRKPFFQLVLALLDAAEKLVHAHAHFFGAVDGEGQLGHMADTHAIANLGADEGARRHQTFEGGLLVLFVAVNGDEDATGFPAGREYRLRDIARRNPRVGEFAFEHGCDLLRKGADDAIAVMVSCSLFGHWRSALRVTKSGIANDCARRFNGNHR